MNVDQAILTADRFRRFALRPVAGTSFGGRCVRDRSLRTTVLALVHILGALVVTLLAPLPLLIFAPLFLAAPHVVADVRYLFLRPIFPLRRQLIAPLMVCAAGLTISNGLAVVSGTTELGGVSLLSLSAFFGVAAILSGVLLSGASRSAVAIASAVVLSLGVPLVVHSEVMLVALGFMHNFIAVFLWYAVSRKDGPECRALAVVGAFLALTLFVFAVGPDLSASLGADGGAGQWGITSSLHYLRTTLAPGVEPAMADRLLLVFAFSQSVHYAVWLRLIPAAKRFNDRPAPSTFRRSFAELRHDLGSNVLPFVVAVCLAAPLFGVFAPLESRAVVLALFTFHGWLELAIIAHGSLATGSWERMCALSRQTPCAVATTH